MALGMVAEEVRGQDLRSTIFLTFQHQQKFSCTGLVKLRLRVSFKSTMSLWIIKALFT